MFICVSAYYSLYAMRVCLYDIKLQYWQKPCHLCQTFSKVEPLMHITHSKVLLVLGP